MIRASRPGAGRPSSYKPAHALSLRGYFESTVQRIDELVTGGQSESLPFPTVAAWCRKEGHERRAPERWSKEPDFLAALDFAKQVQRDLNQLAVGAGLKFTLKDPQ